MHHTSPDEQDKRDMARLASGHDAALNDLMERHGQRLFHYLIRSLQDESDAADLAQETFVRIYQNRARYSPAQKFSTWLYTIAANLVRDRYRWRSRHLQTSLDHTPEDTGTPLRETLPSSAPSPDQSLQTEEQARIVRRAIAALPEDLRQPLVLAVYQELPQAEIAGILGCSIKAVETRIYRARQQLRALLSQDFPKSTSQPPVPRQAGD